MRGVTVLLVCVSVLALGGCKRKHADPSKAHVPLAAGGAPIDDADASDAVVEDARAYAVRTWSFALERYEMRIEDLAMSTALDEVLTRTGAELAVNGGFFDPAGKPLGLVMSEGAITSKLTPALSGGVVTSNGTLASLWEAETFVMPEGVKLAIQCRPRLVVGGAPNVRRDDGQRAERTALCLRDGGKTVDVLVVRDPAGENVGPSLFALGKFLARRGCEGALNLDGGPSTGVAWREEGAVRLLAPRRPVRHALTFKRRGS